MTEFFPLVSMPKDRPTDSGDAESETNERSPQPNGRAAQPSGSSKLGNFDIRLKAVAADLQSGGPEVNFQWLVGYIDGVLDPAAMQQVGRNIVTWRAWYDAYWETVGADDSEGEAKV